MTALRDGGPDLPPVEAVEALLEQGAQRPALIGAQLREAVEGVFDPLDEARIGRRAHATASAGVAAGSIRSSASPASHARICR